MKNRILKFIICFGIILCLVVGICACGDSSNTDTGTNQNGTNTDTSSNSASDSTTDTDTNEPINTYTVTFYIGSEKYSSVTVNEGDVVTAPKPIKPGYMLSVWLYGESAWDFSTPITNNITLSSKWLPEAVEIKFDANGGTGEMDVMLTEVKGSVKLITSDFTRAGYKFKGWATEPDADVFYADEATFYAGTLTEYTLYAVWEANTNKLVLDSNSPFVENTIIDVKTDATYLLEQMPTRKYHSFLGWSKTKDGVVDFEPNALYQMGANESYTLYAVWEVNAPVNQSIDVVKNGASSYVIIYTKGNTQEQEFASALASYIKTTYGVTIPCYDNTLREQDKEIIIGTAREQGFVVANSTGSANDFSIAVCENDLVFYAPNEFLLDYMFELSKVEVFTSSGLSVSANGGFKYSASEIRMLHT